jgi:DNA-binding SARP family transcriptional activator/Tfp pilus assembly protein PilF
MLIVNLLGPPEALIGGRPVQVDTRKAIALLAYLVVEKTASRDTLASLLWAESSEERARATLRRTLSSLRAAAGADLIDADRNRVSLIGGIESDLDTLYAELEATSGHDHDPHDVCSLCIPHLRRATTIYRGSFLQGFAVRSSPEFEDWVRGMAESTRLRVGDAFHRLATALAANGEYPASISAVNRWIELDNLHEPAHRLLMMLHAWAGDRPGAMAAYRNWVAILDHELGVAPLEETTELYEAILDEDLPPAPGMRRRVRAEKSPLRNAPTDLIDRVTELEELYEALDPVDEAGQLLAVTGAPWMGKTRLLDEVAAEATDRGRLVLVGRAFRMEQTLPYGVATQVLRSAVPHLAEADAQIPAWALAEIGRLLPELGAGPTEPVPDRFGELRVLEAIHRVMSGLAAARPLLIVLDDLQWIDPGSSAVFSYLARRLPGVSMLVVVAARTGEDLLPAAAEMIANADRTIMIGPLTTPQLIPLVDDDEDAAQRLREETGGVPLLVAEALSPEDGLSLPTPGMARYMESRLSEVGDLARQILTAAAVLNGMCDAGLLRETSGRSEEEVVEAVEELVEAGLLRELPESDALGFTLDALERVTYESTSLVRRRLLHRRAARAMSERGHARTDAGLAAAIAAQHGAAGDPEAAGWYRLAGDLARSVYANDSARAFYETSLALGHSDVAGVRLALGELAMTAGDYAGARRELTIAAAHAGPDRLGLIEHRTGEVERLLGRFELAEEHFQRALESHPAPAAVYSDWALLAHRTGDPDKATDLAAKARKAAEGEGEPGQLSRVRNILAVVSADRDQALEHVEQALRLAGDDSILRMAALNNKAVLVSDGGDHDAAIEHVREAVAIAERTGHRHREAALWNHMADLHHRAGRERESQDALTRAVSLFADVDAGDPEPELWLLSRW